ncbi:MAG: DUF1499 domain-containing protein [Alphaproteobacteria bacterium]|nr:DUF1499 domain-containing protein [Alphaproteobacteria bacterium]
MKSSLQTLRDTEGTMHFLAGWCAQVAVFSASLALASLFLHRLFSIPTPVALNLLKLSVVGGLVAVALGALALIDIWRNGSRGMSRVAYGGFIALAVIAWPLLALPQVNAFPEINDISTDLKSPPAFQALAARRRPGANRPEYPGNAFADMQARAFPDLKPLFINRSVAEAYEVSVDAVRRVGMNIVAQKPPGDRAAAQGLIEAYDRTLIWGFYDDVVVRVVGNSVTAQIDIRSASRYGRHDLGRNATRIRALLREIVARLEATVSGPRTTSQPSRKRKKRRNRRN